MADAVRNYSLYLVDPAQWTLGRFIIPLARLDEFEAEAQKFFSKDVLWRLSVLSGSRFADDRQRILEFNSAYGGKAIVDTIETKAVSPAQVKQAALTLSELCTVFVEIPIREDPDEMIRAIAEHHLKAKVRTGGITPDAFPPSRELARFMKSCTLHDVRFKATAGLHHPIRSMYNLTYAPDSEQGMMFGYLNVFLAAAFLRQGVSVEEAISILEEQSHEVFQFDDEEVRWRSHRLNLPALEATRQCFISSFGSCSFREPIDDLQGMGFMHSAKEQL